jgi:hypothetical protein
MDVLSIHRRDELALDAQVEVIRRRVGLMVYLLNTGGQLGPPRRPIESLLQQDRSRGELVGHPTEYRVKLPLIGEQPFQHVRPLGGSPGHTPTR